MQVAPDAPKDLETLVIPESFQLYSPSEGTTEQFLLHDSGPSPDRILIFGRSRSLNVLHQSDMWYADGTFKIAPPLFSQVYILLAKYLDGVHPLLYALLPDKRSQTYERLFQIIIDMKPDLKPVSIACDFEQAAINAFKNKFPGVKIYGCLFHLSKNFRMQMCELDLISKYKNDADFSIAIKMILALAFIKIEDLNNAIDLLTTEIPDEVLPLLDWFEEYYIGRIIRNRRRSARFPPELWNVYERVLNDEDRTNNYAEAANRRLNLQMGVQHPTLWTFISCLRKVQSGRDTFYNQLEVGKSPPRKKKKYIDVDKRIKKLVNNYNNRDIISFLRGIAHNISCH